MCGVSKEITIRVRKLNGIEIMPGLFSAIGAVAGSNPYLSNILGERRIIVRAEIIPTTIEAAMPLEVVFFQKSSIKIAGRLAEAATAKAQPTR